MAQRIKFRRSSVTGRVPTSSSLSLGEFAFNTADGKIFIKRADETIQSVFTTNTLITGSLLLSGSVALTGSFDTTAKRIHLDTGYPYPTASLVIGNPEQYDGFGVLAFGRDALASFTGTAYNASVAFGNNALSHSYLSPNDAFGNSALRDLGKFPDQNSDPTGIFTPAYNIGFGEFAGLKWQGYTSTWIGQYSGPFYNNAYGNYNIGIGPLTMINMSSSAADINQRSRGNTGIGGQSLYVFKYGNNNTIVGHRGMLSLQIGRNNTGVGSEALLGLTGGATNTAIGYLAARYLTTGSNNVIIGTQARQLTSGSNNTVVGSFNNIDLGNFDNNIIFTNGDSIGYRYDGTDTTIYSPVRTQGNLTVTGSGHITGDLTVEGTVVAQEFKTEFVSASIIYQSGSTKFGDTSDDTHSFTGSLEVTSGDTSVSKISINGERNSYLKIQDSGSRYSLLQRRSDLTQGQLRILQNGSTKFIFTDGGYLGINTASVPSRALEVTGEIRSTSGSYLATTDGNVGIGTLLPTEKLQVEGNISGSGNLYINNVYGNTYYLGGRTDAYINNDQLRFRADTERRIWVKGFGALTLDTEYATNGLNIKTGGVDRIKITSDEKIHLKNNTVLSGSLNITGSEVALVGGSFSGSGANLYDIPASGIVGLNLSRIASGSATASISPDKGFEVNVDSHFTGSLNVEGGGTFDPTGGAQVVLKRYADNVNANEFVTAKARGTKAAPTAVQAGDYLGGTEFHGYDGSAYVRSSFILPIVTGSVASGDVRSDLYFSTRQGSGGAFSYPMVITSDKKVGINNTSPTEALDVSGNVKAGNTGRVHLADDEISVNLYTALRRDSLKVGLAGTDFTLGTRQSGGTLNADQLVLKSTGNVGVGTSTPAHTLDVSGSGRFTNGLTVTGSLTVSGSVISDQFGNQETIGTGFQGFNVGDTGTGQVQFFSNPSHGGQPRLTLGYVNSGFTGLNLGYSKLGFGNNYSNTAPQAVVTSLNGDLLFQADTPNAQVNSSIAFEVDNTQRFKIDENGTKITGSLGISGSVTIDTPGTLPLVFKRSGIENGRIFQGGGDLYIGTGDTNIRFNDNIDALVPANSNQSDRDNAISLGYASSRFSNAYLAGLDVSGSTSFDGDLVVTGSLTVSGSGSFTDSLSVPDIYLENSIYHTGDTNTSFRFDNDQVRIFAANYTAFETTGYNGVIKLGSTGNPQDIYLQNDAGVGLFLQKTTGNLGIGTTSPSQKLEVRDGNLIVSASQAQLILDPSNSFGHNLTILATGANTVFSGSATTSFRNKFGTDVLEMVMSSLNPRIYFDGQVYNTGFISASGDLITESDLLVGYNTNLGKKVTIADTGTGQEGIHIRTGQPTIDLQDWNTGGKGVITSNDGNIALQADVSNNKASSNISLQVDTVQRLRVDENGVQITGSINHDGDLTVTGTVTAQEFKTEFVSASIIYRSGSTKFGDTLDDQHSFTGSLELTGSLTVSETGSISYITGDKIFINNQEDGHLIGRLYVDYYGNGNPALRSFNGDYIRFMDSIVLHNNSAKITAGSSYVGDLQFTHDRSGDYGYIFNTTDSGSVMRIDGSGNVGIGTTSPSYKLTVAGHTFLTPDNSHIYFGNQNTFVGERSNSNQLELRGGGSTGNETLYLDNSGRLGFGTSTPTEKLTIKDGNILVQNNGTVSQDANLTLKSHANGESRIIFRDQDGTSGSLEYINQGSSDRFRFGVSGSAEALTIAKDGNVGIGITSPSETLDVADKIRVSSTVTPGGDAQIDLMYINGGTRDASIRIKDQADDSLKGVLGYYGSKLQIMSLDGAESWLGTTLGDTAVLTANGIQNGGNANFFGIYGGDVRRRVGNTTQFYIARVGGNVGIGTDTPSERLTVEGSISASGAIYDNSGSPGTPGQMILSTGTGFEWAPNVAESAQDLIITGKNKEATDIQKGTPLYFSGSDTGGNLVGIYVADAGDPDRMPAGGIAAETIASDAEGDVYIYGYISNVDTSAFNAGDSVFVAVGGGYTNIKPTGSALIQKLGNVEKVHPSNGSGVIQGPSWYNDLPNWEEGKLMVGRSDGQPVTSSFVHLDEDNSKLIVTGSLTVSGSSTFTNIGPAVLSGSVELAQQADSQGLTIKGFDDESDRQVSLYLNNFGNTVLTTNSTTTSINTAAAKWTGTSYIRITPAANNYLALAHNTNSKAIVGKTSGTARLEVQGMGASSSTTAFRVENSATSASLLVTDDGVTTLQPATGSVKPLVVKDHSGTYSLELGQEGGANYLFSLRAPHDFTIGVKGSGILTVARTDQNKIWQITAGDSIRTNQSGGSIYSGHLGAFGFYTYGTTNAMPVLYQNSRTSNNDYGFKLVGKTGGTEFIGVAADRFGNVGIGTDSPAYKLDVSGSGNFTDGLTVTGSILHDGDLTVSGTVTAQEFKTEFVSASIIYRSGSTKFGDTADDTHSFTGSIEATGQIDANYFYGTAGGWFRGSQFLEAGNVHTLRVGYGSSGQFQLQTGNGAYDVLRATNTGLVGIGTTSPAYTLDVSGSARVDGRFYFATDGSGNNGLNFRRVGNNVWSLDTSGVGEIYRIAGNSITFKQDTTIQRGGLTVAPTLSVPTHAIKVNHTWNSDSTDFRTLDINVTNTTASLDSNIIDVSVDGTTNFVLDQDFNLGIGTASPTSKLHVSGTNDVVSIEGSGSTILDIQGSQGQLFSVVDSLSGSLMSVNDISGLPIFEVFSDDKVVMGEYGTDALVVTGSRIGIGTSTPAHLVDIDTSNTNAFRIQKNGVQRIMSNTSGANGGFLYTGALGNKFAVGAVGNDFAIHDGSYMGNGEDRLRITQAGNVGLGNSTPSYKLDVSGSGRFTGNLTVEGSFTELSAQRFKENITPLTGSLDKVIELEGVTYNKIGEEKQEIGLIAEQVAGIYPEFVEYDENGQTVGIQYSRLTSVLIESIKELDAKVKAQELFIKDIVSRIEKLESK